MFCKRYQKVNIYLELPWYKQITIKIKISHIDLKRKKKDSEIFSEILRDGV